MLKLTALLRKHPELSLEEFYAYWNTTHAGLALKYQKELRFVRYVQTHTNYHELNDIMRTDRGCQPAYDGVAQLWWESIEDMEAAIKSPEALEAFRLLQEDEKKFIDVPSMSIWMSDEHVMFG